MTELIETVSSLRRPRLLIRAARFGQGDYNRNRDLRRLMRTPVTLTPEVALRSLIEEEEQLERLRVEGDASYSLMRHIELLIAMMAEARMMPRPAPVSAT